MVTHVHGNFDAGGGPVEMLSRKSHVKMRDVDKFEARQFREVGMSVADCAKYFNVSIATLMRGLAETRDKFGPEKLPPRLAGKQRHTVKRRQSEWNAWAGDQSVSPSDDRSCHLAAWASMEGER